jgi:excisionase family DNA binding protein
MAATLIMASVGYAQILEDLRAVVRQELQNLPTASAKSAATVGGIELAQEITRLSKSRIYNLVSERGIPHSKRGNKLYFSRADLMAWVEAGNRQEVK